jgi:hypothetical protein
LAAKEKPKAAAMTAAVTRAPSGKMRNGWFIFGEKRIAELEFPAKLAIGVPEAQHGK